MNGAKLKIIKSILFDKYSKKKASSIEEFPKTVLVDTTNYCNLNCSMCARKFMSRKKGFMEENLYRKIVDEIASVNKNVRLWMNFYGEGLAIKNAGLFNWISYAKSKGINKVLINTNGMLLDEECARKLVECGLDEIHIGIDAFTEETYRKLRVGGNFVRVVENTKKAIEIVNNSFKKRPKIVIQCVETIENAGEIKKFIDYWKHFKVSVMIRPKVSWAGAVEADNLVKIDRHPCYWLMETCVIGHNGLAFLCAVDYDGKFVAGDVNHETIKSVWNGKLKEMRILHTKGQYELLPQICRNCKDWQASEVKYY
ncbi:MAG: radical SAM/SPASM domain-containing protein [Minisyncoccia bacterium]